MAWPWHPACSSPGETNVGSLISSTLAEMPGRTGTPWVNDFGVKIRIEGPGLPSFRLLWAATGRAELAWSGPGCGQESLRRWIALLRTSQGVV